MAWRPSRFLLEGELDNTTLGKVVGWMKFAGMRCKVTFDLIGNFHRDIRGAKIRFKGDGKEGDPEASSYMKGFACHQSGKVGDMTAGLPPIDYSTYPYLEWYSEENGRVVLELDPEQVEVIGKPIPACESDPVSREEQQRNMAEFLSGLCRETQCPVLVVGKCPHPVSDPKFTHWVVEGGQVIGEAHSVEPEQNGISFAFVRLFGMPEMAEFGSIETEKLVAKKTAPRKEPRR
jgi:hypothetical protein